MTECPKLAVLLSGSGSTLQNLIDRIAAGELRANIVGVVSSKPDVPGVERARKANIPLAIATPKPSETFRERTWGPIRDWAPDLVICAGWLHLLEIPPEFRMRVLNVHPSLLPAFGGRGMYGARVHKAALESGAKVSGCTVHFVDDEYDRGPILAQATVPILDGDTVETLAARVQAAERDLYPECIRRIGERLEFTGV